ncbi:unannotated protein [freshwater metagenome]|uniref:Unannotated protein n=1 Tax=freshwater metagenome TaxID=449393 RepID=A0A6J6E0Y3_9ZZZZ
MALTPVDPAIERREHPQLALRGVLVLIKEDCLELQPLRLTDLSEFCRESRGHRHLIIEGEGVLLASLLIETLHHRKECKAELGLINDLLMFKGEFSGKG